MLGGGGERWREEEGWKVRLTLQADREGWARRGLGGNIG